MKKLALIFAVLMVVGTASAMRITPSNNLKSFKRQYNRQSDQVPGFVGKIIGGERVNFKIESKNSNRTIGVSFDGVKISKIKDGGLDNPTLKVRTNRTTVKEILNSGDKYSTLQKKLDDGSIKYHATNVSSGIKVAMFDALRGLAKMLGL